MNWSTGGIWHDATANAFPDWLQINFNGIYSIGEIDVFSVQDNYAAPVDPTPAMTFTQYGLSDFQVQYLDGQRMGRCAGWQRDGQQPGVAQVHLQPDQHGPDPGAGEYRAWQLLAYCGSGGVDGGGADHVPAHRYGDRERCTACGCSAVGNRQRRLHLDERVRSI